ncbi:hypothetical protein N8E87_07510 [Avibacterium paragallinarum]|uniref:hypothetical protein n=1 Tax=Avibacterium paragallinarum TaxID=728 RepID=UPI0021F6F2D2|nr:hypothetical protein [Avibacterium paragallinarum]UXN36046.1 hypothetical protein N8E87_07510 [Avibacterium paragallinarum]
MAKPAVALTTVLPTLPNFSSAFSPSFSINGAERDVVPAAAAPLMFPVNTPPAAACNAALPIPPSFQRS